MHILEKSCYFGYYSRVHFKLVKTWMTQIQTTAEWWYLGAGGVPMQPVLVHDFSLISNRMRSFNIDLPLSPPNTYIASLYAIAVCLLRLKIKYLVSTVVTKRRSRYKSLCILYNLFQILVLDWNTIFKSSCFWRLLFVCF